MKKETRWSLIVICIICLVSSSGLIFSIKYNQYKERKAFEELESKKQTENLEEESTETDEVLETEPTVEEPEIKQPIILSEYKKLYEENSDLYGWIKIDDTIIDYPVMHTSEDLNYYNHHDWNRNETISGTPFVDGRTIYGETENTLVYGHNMKDRTMFGSLREYKEKSFYETHKYIQFDTIYEKEKYEIISVSKGIVYYDVEPPKDEYLFYDHVELDTKEQFNQYVQNIKDNEYFETGVTAEFGDKLITLCTCDYWTENARLLVVAKKIN